MNDLFLYRLFKESQYILDSSGDYLRCRDCNQIVDLGEQSNHGKGRYHESRASKRTNFRKILASNWELFEKYHARIDAIHYPSWRREMYGILFMQIFQPGSNELKSIDDAIISASLAKFEMMERISILELSIWKGNCILHHEAENDSGTFWAYSWIRIGWKSNKDQRSKSKNDWKPIKTDSRESNAITTIIGQVLPYLIPEDESTISKQLEKI